MAKDNWRIYEGSEGYTAQIVRIGTLDTLPGLDRLRGTRIQDSYVLVGTETKEGQVGIFFRSETQLSETYLAANNLYRHAQRNNDPAATPGFFDDNGRVRAIRLKGVLSTGFWMPIASLAKPCNVDHDWEDRIDDTLRPGTEFNEAFGVEICRKYVPKNVRTPGTPGSRNSVRKTLRIQDRVNTRVFAEHPSTTHLMKMTHTLSPKSKIWISEKMHGTSWRYGIAPVTRLDRWRDRIARLFGIEPQRWDYLPVVGSRRVIRQVGLENLEKANFYAKAIYETAAESLSGMLNKGEIVYGELIGWAGDAPIQKGYTYNISDGHCVPVVYRITNVNEDGVAVDLCWPALQERVRQLGMNLPPHIFYGSIEEYLGPRFNLDTFQIDFAKRLIDQYLDRPSFYDPQTIIEGVVVAVEGCNVHQRGKLKSPKFLELETKWHDEGVTDMEEQQDGQSAE